MKRSTEGIITTHIGSLPMPAALREMHDARRDNQPYDREAFETTLKDSVDDLVTQQIDVGLDVVNDGEQAKTSWSGYIRDRLSGFEMKPLRQATDRNYPEFRDYYRDRQRRDPETETISMVCVGPISYAGQADVQRDIDNLQAGLAHAAGAGRQPKETFMAAVGPDNVGYQPGQNQYYRTEEDYVDACAAALRSEYKAIADAGFLLQIDTPVRKFNALSLDLADFRRRFGRLVELLNETLKDVPEEQIRLHICYGGGKEPHTGDAQLKDFADLLVNVRTSGISLDQNVRHEHDWKVWKDVKLPDGVALIPGVVAHTTDVIEHPELISDRIVRLAGIVGRENVIAGTDCGLGGRTHADIAWAKFRSMVEGARLATAELWG